MAVELPCEFHDQDYTNTWSCNFDSSSSSSDDFAGSVLSSPVESELSSSSTTETESQESEEDFMAADQLSRQMANNCMLQDDDRDHNKEKQATFWPLMMNIQSKQSLIDDQIRSIQYYKLNLKQDQPMRALFHEWSGSKTKSCDGTGVFLPQGSICHASDSRKKQGCSTVLIPARVVQALKQHFDTVGVPSTSIFNNGNFPCQNDGLMGLKNNNSSLNSQQSSNHQEIDLPQEWTY